MGEFLTQMQWAAAVDLARDLLTFFILYGGFYSSPGTSVIEGYQRYQVLRLNVMSLGFSRDLWGNVYAGNSFDFVDIRECIFRHVSAVFAVKEVSKKYKFHLLQPRLMPCCIWKVAKDGLQAKCEHDFSVVTSKIFRYIKMRNGISMTDRY